MYFGEKNRRVCRISDQILIIEYRMYVRAESYIALELVLRETWKTQQVALPNCWGGLLKSPLYGGQSAEQHSLR